MPAYNENDGISQKPLDAFTAIVEDKLANVATKECKSELRQKILDEQLKIQELEVKVFVMERYVGKLKRCNREFARLTA